MHTRLLVDPFFIKYRDKIESDTSQMHTRLLVDTFFNEVSR